MHNAPVRYSPTPVESDRWMSGKTLLGGDPLAANLAWLSFSSTAPWAKDPAFTTQVYHTTWSLRSTCRPDLLRSAPDNETVRGLLKLPPPAFVKRLLELPRYDLLPLYAAYGRRWADEVKFRAREWVDPSFEVEPITDMAQAKEVISRL
jgi:hypothetical protein